MNTVADDRSERVAPFTGAWIEIATLSAHYVQGSSLPLRERGLKSRLCGVGQRDWRRSLYGSVD